MDASNVLGKLPNGPDFRSDLCAHKKVPGTTSLQRVFSLLDENEIEHLVTKRFVNCTPGPTAEMIRSFIWKRIYTWNIDDVLELAYTNTKARQKPASIHFSDWYRDADNLAEVQIIHLHGSVIVPTKNYVFSNTEYIGLIKDQNLWMITLATFLSTDPFIIAGTSLEEPDLEYYLSFRTPTTVRSDRGPSILVELDDNAITKSICERHHLLHFVGYANHFLEYCLSLLPNSPTPYELLSSDTKNLLPENTPELTALKFNSDFELVPATAPINNQATRFMFGHFPSWSDLASQLDIPRSVVGGLVPDIESRLQNPRKDRLVLLSANAGTGRTTLVRRVAFELARRGIRVILSSSMSRISGETVEVMNAIDGPLVVVIDDFADQVSAIADLLNRNTKKDIVVLGAERAYRLKYIRQGLGATKHRLISGLQLTETEASSLVNSYTQHGLVGADKGLKKPGELARKLLVDPIAIACCRILNDLKPLDRIVSDLIADTPSRDLQRYLMAAIARHCFAGGLPYEILMVASGADGLMEQFRQSHPLPIAFSDRNSSFVVPENTTLAEYVLESAARNESEDLFNIFVTLAQTLASRVNRMTIINRLPEARLAGRLFDYDDIVKKFLRGKAPDFYAKIKTSWQWNSRYWGQVALLNLDSYRKEPSTNQGRQALERAVQHARHGVSIERHPFPLTTLGTVLMAQMVEPGHTMSSLFNDAFNQLTEAIRREAQWLRSAAQPYVVLFNGTKTYLNNGGILSNSQNSELSMILSNAAVRFQRDTEIMALINYLQQSLSH